MRSFTLHKQMGWILLVSLLAGLLGLTAVSYQSASAAPPRQEGGENEGDGEDTAVTEVQDTQDCQECHLDVAEHWQDSAHAHAFDDENFQRQWQGLGEPAECLACHTTNFQPATGEYDAEGVECRACHGNVTGEHPPEPVPILADTEYCGTCHTTTLGEWHRTAHATEDIGCMDCHDPHSQGQLFDVPDDLCINCHKDDMEHYLEDLHVQKGIGCVDCHALVIPPDPLPDDGIVPTGHSFIITPETCVACHTDALHAGFSLPGYEGGAKAANVDSEGEIVPVSLASAAGEDTAVTGEEELSPEQQIQALETALASRNISLLFQGAIVGLVLGGTTAWFIAHNIRARDREEEDHG